MAGKTTVVVASWAATTLLLTSCVVTPAEAPRRQVRILTGDSSGTYHGMGRALADIYNQHLHVKAEPTPVLSAGLALDALDDGQAELAFSGVGLAYSAFSQGLPSRRTPHARLRGVATLYRSAYHFIVKSSSPIRTIRDIRGKRVGMVLTSIDPRALNTRLDLVLRAYGVEPTDVEIVRITIAHINGVLENDEVDVVMAPAASPDANIKDIADRLAIRLVPVDEDSVTKIRAKNPFFKPVVIPPAAYRGQTSPVEAVGYDNVLLTHEGLDEDVVYRLTKTLFDSLPALAGAYPLAREIDPERASALMIALHAGAARYYRERQLLK